MAHGLPGDDTLDTITVIIADDHPLIRSGIRATLAVHTDLRVVAEAETGQQAVDLCAAERPGVLLLDLGMPGPKPSRIVRDVRKISPATRVLVLTAHDEDTYIRQLMRVGIAGYLLKEEAAENVVRAIRSIHAGGAWFSQGIADKFLRWRFGHGQEEGEDVSLTRREKEVLRLIARGWDNARIATRLSLAEQTVRNYASAIYNKIDVSSRAEAVVWAREHELLEETQGD